MLYKVILTFESVDEILKCDHSNKSHRAGAVCDAVHVHDRPHRLVLVFVCNPSLRPFKLKQ